MAVHNISTAGRKRIGSNYNKALNAQLVKIARLARFGKPSKPFEVYCQVKLEKLDPNYNLADFPGWCYTLTYRDSKGRLHQRKPFATPDGAIYFFLNHFKGDEFKQH
jgi:hypothetical protein